MLSYEGRWERVELRLPQAGRTVTTTAEGAEVEKSHNQVVEGIEAFFLDWESSVTAPLHVSTSQNPHLV